MKWHEILVLVFICDALQYPIFCSQERARQRVTNQNDVHRVYTLQVDIQILAEQFNSLVDVLSEIASPEIISESHATGQQEYDLMIDVQKVSIQVVNFLIWGSRD